MNDERLDVGSLGLGSRVPWERWVRWDYEVERRL